MVRISGGEVESIVKRMRWKAMQFLRKLDQSGTETYVFKTNKCPPPIEELNEFESDLVLMVKNIQFRPVRNNFLAELKNSIKEINNTGELLLMLINQQTFLSFLKSNTRNINVITL